MEFSVEVYIIIFLLIGFSGFIDAIAGGGGLISIPTYLAFGVPAHFVLGTNKMISSIGTTIAVTKYVRAQLIHWPITLSAIVTSGLGSIVGARLSAILSKEWMLYLLLVIVPLVLFLNHRYLKNHIGVKPKFTKGVALLAALIGLVIGAYDGFFGPGTGSFLLLAYVWILGFNLKEASANARIINYASNVTATLTFLWVGQILWSVVLVGACGSIAGNYLGSHMVVKNADRVVKPAFNFVLTLLIFKCAYDVWIR